MEDLGPPTAYLALGEGVPVYDRGGQRVGVVEHVLADEEADIFDGLIVHTMPLVGHRLFADVDQIAELRERGVLLSVERGELHPPGATAPAGDDVDTRLEDRLRRAWRWISERE